MSGILNLGDSPKYTLLMSMTTNAKQLDEAMLKFMSDYRIAAYVSLDGPQHIHSEQSQTTPEDFCKISDHVKLASKALHYLGLNAVYDPAKKFMPS